MDQTKLVKEIKTLRSLLKVARSNIIRKLTRDHKFWTAKAANGSDNVRAKRRAESSIAVINHIKSLDTLTLVKEVLRYQPLQNGKSTNSPPIGHISMARLREDKKLGTHLKTLERQYGAGENSTLVTVVSKNRTIKSAVAKKQKKEKQVKRLEKKKQKSQKDTKRKEQLKDKVAGGKPKRNGAKVDEFDEATLARQVNEQYESDESGGSDFEERNIELNESYSDDDDDEDALDERSSISVSVSEDDDEDTPSEDEEQSERNAVRRVSKVSTKRNRSDIALPSEVTVKKPILPIEWTAVATSNKNAEKYKAPEDEDEEDGYEMIQDSFFITETGQQYVAVAPKISKKPNGEDEEEEEEEESWKLVNRREKRKQLWRGTGDDEDAVDHEEGPPPKHRKGNRSEMSTDANEKEALHPSWAAKQAQKGIKPFAGRKVVFDADGAAESNAVSVRPSSHFNRNMDSDLHPSWAAKQAQQGIKPFAGKKVVFGAEDTSESNGYSTKDAIVAKSDLHPSWAAKQNQKGIKPFAGKKVVFDAEGTAESDATSNSKGDLHPSWAAKQAQQGIKPFTGKKVVFDAEDGSAIITRPPNNVPAKTDMHPSWAAKQAQKGIKPFAGKKVVFDAEDMVGSEAISIRERTNFNSTSDMHPSWAAKQAQKGIKPFAGKKVVFDAEETGDSKSISNPNFNFKSDLHPSWTAKQAQQGIKPFAGKKIVFGAEDGNEGTLAVAKKPPIKREPSVGDLHPSWAAKQAQSGIKQFAGKKVVFDTEDDGGRNDQANDVNDHPNASRMTKTAHQTVTKRPSLAAETSSDVHPSWAAKQAQKRILPFAGKKVTFDNDDGTANRATAAPQPKSQPAQPSDLHPSWAAKLARSGIKTFAGTKISFDD